MRTCHIPLYLFLISLLIHADFAAAQKIRIASSPNPVVSGAGAYYYSRRCRCGLM